MSLEYHYIDPNTSNNKLIRMIIKAHYYDVLSTEQLQNLTEIVEMSIKRITDNTSSINICTYADLLNNSMKHIEVPIMFVSKEIGMIIPSLSWIQSYSYMYDYKNEQNSIIVMVAVKCTNDVRVTRIKLIR